MDSFLKDYFPGLKNLKKENLPGDGGHRKYTRIYVGKKTFILMSCGEKDPSLGKFIEVQKRLKPFVSVPKLFHKDIEKGLLLLEDLGDQSLEQFFLLNGKKSSLSFYHQALKQLISIQDQTKILKTDTLFDRGFFLKESETAVYHLQTYINQSCKQKSTLFDEKSSEPFRKDMNQILFKFKPEDFVYCHRDFHSRNLMIKKARLICIDFQDAGLGAWYYDLTSLLYDSYVSLSVLDKKGFIQFYFDHLPNKLRQKVQSVSHVEFMVKLQFLQRGFKACGCFAAFKNRDKKDTHLKYIQPTLRLLEKEAVELSYKGISQYIRQLREAIDELPAYQPI